MTIGIYKITNKTTGECYVGQSRNIERRFMEHKTPQNIQKNYPLAKSIKKYGLAVFYFEIIHVCKIDELDYWEREYIRQLKPAFNRNAGGKGNFGYNHTDKTKQILSRLAKAQWDRLSEEQKQFVLNNYLTGPKIGHEVSPETREKLRQRNLGKKQSQETIKKRSEKMRVSMKGNANRKRAIVATNIKTHETQIFPMIITAARFIKTDPTHLVHVLKKKNPIVKDWYVSYLCSVMTNGDECSRVGAEMRTASKCVASLNRDEEIVYASEMVNQGIQHDLGILQLAERSGQVKNIIDEVVYEGQLVKKNKFTGEYEFDEDAKTSDKVIGYMARIELINGFAKTIYWTLEEVKAHATKFSQAYQKGWSSPWKSDFDAMARKTVLKALLRKYAPKDIALQQAIRFDQAVITPNTTGDTDEEVVIDAFNVDYADNKPAPIEEVTEAVDPSKGLFEEENTKPKSKK